MTSTQIWHAISQGLLVVEAAHPMRNERLTGEPLPEEACIVLERYLRNGWAVVYDVGRLSVPEPFNCFVQVEGGDIKEKLEGCFFARLGFGEGVDLQMVLDDLEQQADEESSRARNLEEDKRALLAQLDRVESALSYSYDTLDDLADSHRLAEQVAFDLRLDEEENTPDNGTSEEAIAAEMVSRFPKEAIDRPIDFSTGPLTF